MGFLVRALFMPALIRLCYLESAASRSNTPVSNRTLSLFQERVYRLERKTGENLLEIIYQTIANAIRLIHRLGHDEMIPSEGHVKT